MTDEQTSLETEPESDPSKVWLALLGMAATIFFIVGTAMLLLDQNYLNALQYLSSSILYFVAMYLISKKRVDVRSSESGATKYLQMGFIFSVVGLNLNIGVWGLGVILFVKGLIKKEEFKGRHNKNSTHTRS